MTDDYEAGPSRDGDGWVPGWSPELGTRIASIIEAVGGPGKASALIDVKPEQISKWRDGKARAPFLALATLAKIAGVSLDWIATGEEANRSQVSKLSRKSAPLRQRTDLAQTAREIGVHTIPRVQPAISRSGIAAVAFPDGAAFIRLPSHSPRTQDEGGTAQHFPALPQSLLLSTEWVRDVLHRPPEQLICVQVQGDAMTPRMRGGDLIIVDCGVTQIRDHGIYCFDDGGNLLIRRILYRLTGRPAQVISDNPLYPSEDREIEELEATLVGLVIWHGEKLN
jgi:phage repressor protein C with HTH and peptisase S24 domain